MDEAIKTCQFKFSSRIFRFLKPLSCSLLFLSNIDFDRCLYSSPFKLLYRFIRITMDMSHLILWSVNSKSLMTATSSGTSWWTLSSLSGHSSSGLYYQPHDRKETLKNPTHCHIHGSVLQRFRTDAPEWNYCIHAQNMRWSPSNLFIFMAVHDKKIYNYSTALHDVLFSCHEVLIILSTIRSFI